MNTSKETKENDDQSVEFIPQTEPVIEVSTEESAHTAVANLGKPLENGVYATFRAEKLRINPDIEIRNYHDIVLNVSYHIFFAKAVKLGMKATEEEISKSVTEITTGENKPYYEKARKQSKLSEQQYLEVLRKQSERDIILYKYTARMVGEPDKMGGQEYKKAMNDYINQTFLDHKNDITVNESLLAKLLK